MLLFIFLKLFILVWLYIDFYVIAIHTTGINLAILLIIIFVSNIVLMNPIDYLGIIESVLFLVYICPLQFSMIMFILTNDLVISFINRDLLGITSYLLINYWISKVNSGIKAIVYNKVGDIFPIVWLVILYDLVSSSNYAMFKLVFNIILCLCYPLLYSIPIIVIIFSKSAQLPFFSRLANAMSAPTPIPALLHPSTMVIAGVYLGLIMDDQLVLLFDISCFFSLAYAMSLSITLIFSLWSAISVSDVKSIIASPTISQISYMFLALVIHPILSLLIYYFMLYVRACYLFYLEHLFILN